LQRIGLLSRLSLDLSIGFKQTSRKEVEMLSLWNSDCLGLIKKGGGPEQFLFLQPNSDRLLLPFHIRVRALRPIYRFSTVEDEPCVLGSVRLKF
jgi:hypothetical protein